MGKIISVANQKGGVGKTTTAINVAAGLAKAGRPCLLIDVDPQCNATSGLGTQPSASHPLLRGESIGGHLRTTGVAGLELLPGSHVLSQADGSGPDHAQRRDQFRRAVRQQADRFYATFLDCPPSLGQLTRFALAASDSVLIPIQCEYFAMEGLTQLLDIVRSVKAQHNPELDIEGIVLTMYDDRLELADEVAGEVRQYFGAEVFGAVVPRDVEISEAPSHGQCILDYAPRSRGSRAYVELCREVIERDQE